MSESNKNQTLVVLLQPITMGDDTSKETISENDGRHNSTVDVMLQTLISLMVIMLTMKMMIIITSNDYLQRRIEIPCNTPLHVHVDSLTFSFFRSKIILSSSRAVAVYLKDSEQL